VPYFAYPFGHFNDFLTKRYLPSRGRAAGIRAAFTTQPRPVSPTDNVWALPRFTCGHHWKSSRELANILANA